MGRIKFRYWLLYLDNHIEAHFFTIEDIENHRGLNRKALFEAGIKILSRDRYTGLKDKNGKDIYERDTTKFWDYSIALHRIGEIYYDITEFRIKSKGGYLSPKNYFLNEVTEIEIIGSVYDNPKFFKEKKQ